MKKIIPLLIAMISTLAMTPAPQAGHDTDSLEIFFLDVGQGDAMILSQPGICSALIDAGPLIHGHRITERLQDLEISELDIAVITHPHLDHFGGLFDLHSRFIIKQLYDNGRTNTNREYFSDYQKIRQKQPYNIISGGDSITCGDIKFEILSPGDTEQDEQDLNASSLVLMISYHHFRLLHMGDLAGPAERLFLKNGANLNADVIKIAHHGAADATSEDLLNQVRPELAIISTSEDNWISAPSQTVLERLKKHGIAYLRTDQHKTIKLVVSRNGQFSFLHGAAGD